MTFFKISRQVIKPLNIPVTKYIPYGPERHTVLFIHGGSKVFSQGLFNKNIFKILALSGMCSVTFDFRGMILGGPDFYETGLHTRIQDADAVIDHLKLDQPSITNKLTVIGLSMGACVAAHIANKHKPKNLILVAPAVYDKKLVEEQVPFGERFSEIIRKKDSWKASDSFKFMEQYFGSFLVVQYQKDEVVPHEVPFMLFLANHHFFDKEERDSSFTVLKNLTHINLFSSKNKKEKMFLSHLLPWIEERI